MSLTKGTLYNKLNTGYVENELIKNHYNMENVIYGYKYIDNGGNRGGYDDNVPTMEITTRIGCSVNCRYCPQFSLITNYCTDKLADKPIKQAVVELGTIAFQISMIFSSFFREISRKGILISKMDF